MAADTLLRHYRGAISLSNVGVTLLERGAHGSAMETLKGAIHVMQSLFGGQTRRLRPDLNIDTMVMKATKELIKTTPESSSSAPYSLDVSLHSVNLETIQSLLQPETETPTILPVRLVDYDLDALFLYDHHHHHHEATDIVSAVIIYNLGTAYLSQAFDSDDRRKSVLAGSRKLFELSTAILQNIEQSQEHQEHQDGIHLLLIYLTYVLVQRGLVSVTSLQGDSFARQAYHEILECTKTSAARLVEATAAMWGPLLDKKTAAAA
jgi:hypothetical protein